MKAEQPRTWGCSQQRSARDQAEEPDQRNVLTKPYADVTPIFMNEASDGVVTGGFSTANQGTTLIARGDL
jgi:hypothetical protein